MNQIRKLFDSLSLKQRIGIGAAAVAAVLLIYGVVHWTSEMDFKPLYTGLAPEDAGAVLAKIRETGVQYRLAENGSTVLVPSGKVAETRLQLATAGIPKSGRIGFEIFDKENFGASDFTEQINFHRALEGELERSVTALSGVELARVHITFPKDSIFSENRQPAKASVLVKLRPGVHLSPQNVQAICQLAASAVEGLAPEAVSVLDMRGNLLSRARTAAATDDSSASPAALEYRQAVEKDISQKIAATLTPLLGEGKFRSGVSADCDLSSGEQSEETFDPGKSVMTSSTKTEDVSGTASSAGVPGTASNLPRPPARTTTGRGGVSRRTETIAYQTSRVVRRVRLPQGALKRLSVSVLVDYGVRWNGEGQKAKRTIQPPSPETLKSIHDLVAASIGFDTQRGDQLVIESLPFESTLNPEAVGDAPVAPPVSSWENLLRNKNYLYGGGAVIAFFAGLIGFMVWRLRRKSGVKATEAHKEIEGAAGAKQAIPSADSPILDLSAQLQNQLAEQKAEIEKQAQQALELLRLPSVRTQKTEALTKHIGAEAKKDSTVMAQVLRTWLAEKET